MGGDRRGDREFPDDFYPKLLGAIYPEAVRQAQAERAQRREHAALERYLLWGVLPDGSVDAGIPPSFTFQTSEDAGRTWTPPSPLPAWRTRTPAEVAEYDRRFLHVLGIEAL